MDKYIYDENNGLWYELQGDYYIPCLTLSAEEERPMEEMYLRLIQEMAERQGVTEQLKAEQSMEWIGKMGNLQASAREVVNAELIYI